MSGTSATTTISSQCAACGNEGGDDDYLKKMCTECKLVKYCGAACQKAHRPEHEKACKERAAELYDEALFRDPPPKDDCPICCIPLPSWDPDYIDYRPCCGKMLCCGCARGVAQRSTEIFAATGELILLCPYCRAPAMVSDKEMVKRCKQRIEVNDAEAFFELAGWYHMGTKGFRRDLKRGMEFLLKAAELGCLRAHKTLAMQYAMGSPTLEKDWKNAERHWAHAAMRGDEKSRFYLGTLEGNLGSAASDPASRAVHGERAQRHYTMAAMAGNDDALDMIKKGFRTGHVTKDEFARILRAWGNARNELKSDIRDKALSAQRRRKNDKFDVFGEPVA